MIEDCFDAALPVLDRLEAAGFQTVFVGGSVRDHLMGRDNHDVDIATQATPEEVKRVFRKTVDVGIEHGTVMVLHEGNAYEVTTFRTEGEYEGFRKPKEVKFIRSLHEDLKRRDFTMNAIAMTKDKELIDPFNGRKAIHERSIETVGEADERFREDALRMMRALRFTSQLSFTCPEYVIDSIRRNRRLLEHISIERITSEFEKLMRGINVKEAFSLLTETKLHEVLPGLGGQEEMLKQYASLELRLLPSLEEKWAALMLLKGEQNQDAFLRSWKLPVKQMKMIRAIVKTADLADFHDPMALFMTGMDIMVKAASVKAVIEHENPASLIQKIKEDWNALPIHSLSELEVNGNDLMEWTNKRSGPWVKEMLQSITAGIIEGKLKNEREAIYKEVTSCNHR